MRKLTAATPRPQPESQDHTHSYLALLHVLVLEDTKSFFQSIELDSFLVEQFGF